MSSANIAFVQSLYAAFQRGDIPTIVAALAPDITWEVVGRPSDFPTLGRRRGQAAVQEFFQIVNDNLAFSEFSPNEFYATEEKVFVLGRYAATLKKTGKSATAEWIHIFSIQGGKVAAFKEFADTVPIIEAYRG